ncbi:hypothetical protein FRC12_008544 [Ceratobasidium sp. 428]|nr:hypothetical protein FRC12_008544 [Ceratobasidium sp. 428]
MIFDTEYEDTCVTFTISALKIDEDYACAGKGLIYMGFVRASLENISHEIANRRKWETEKDGKKKASIKFKDLRTKTWLRAQCQFLGLHHTSRHTEKALEDLLLERIKTGKEASVEVQELEAKSNQRFLNGITAAQEFIGDTEFETSPPRLVKRKRSGLQTTKDACIGSNSPLIGSNSPLIQSNSPLIQSNDCEEQTSLLFAPTPTTRRQQLALNRNPLSRSPSAFNTPEAIPEELPDESAPVAAPAGMHARGGNSGIIDTTKLRARAPKSAAEAFLNLMVLSDERLQDAKEVTTVFSSLGLDSSATLPLTETETMETQCRRVAGLCQATSINSDVSAYAAVIAQAELAIWFLRMSAKRREDFSVMMAFNMLGDTNIRYDQFKHWRQTGHIFLRLMHATSVHMLSVIVVSPIRTGIRSLLPMQLFEVENGLRDPSRCKDISEPLVQLIKEDVIYFHRSMMRAYPNGIKLDNRWFGVNLVEDDAYLQDLFRRSYKPHDAENLARGLVWTCPYTAIPGLADQPSPTYFIYTAYNPSLPGNSALPPELQDRKNTAAIHGWTTRERAYAESASTPSTLDDLNTQLCEQLKTGEKEKGKYLKISADLTALTDLVIYGAGKREEDVVCVILSADTIGCRKVDKMWNMVKHAVRFDNIAVDSAALGVFYKYIAYHLGPWNQYAAAGQDAPSGNTRLHMGPSSQSLPYNNRSVDGIGGRFDPRHFGECPYEQLNDGIRDLLRPAIAKLRRYLPGLMNQHEVLSDSLGPVYPLGSAPFCMTVLNVQSVSRGHRDAADMEDNICLIFAFGEFEGGALCVLEPGIVYDLPNGQFAAIRSKRNVHFNLDYKGRRFSFVFTSDNELKRWEERRNGWLDLKPIPDDIDLEL